MKLVRHPNVVRLHEVQFLLAVRIVDISFPLSVFENQHDHYVLFCHVQVLASRKKIFIILEFITGGELFDKIVRPRSS